MQLDARSAVSSWSLSGWLASTTLATLAFWSMFGACVDAPDVAGADGPESLAAPPSVRAIVSWDTRACGPPHRVIVEVEPRGEVVDLHRLGEPDAGGAEPLAASVPCSIGEITLEVPHAGVYIGRAYAWSTGAGSTHVGSTHTSSTDAGTTNASASSPVPLMLVLDAPVTRWEVPTPR